MKLWTQIIFYTASILIISGCATKPKPSVKQPIDNSLPIVNLTNNGIYPDMNAIAFEWKEIKDSRVKGLYIYKREDESKDSKLTYYDTISNRFTTHYLDKNIVPNTKYSYIFKTYDNKSESKSSRLVKVKSLPALNSVSWLTSIQNMPRSAKIIWRPHTNQKVKSYFLQRKGLEDTQWKKIATIDGRLNAEYIDTDLKDNYSYKYRLMAYTYDNIVSSPSKVVSVITKPLPKPIEKIIVSRDLPKRIELRWAKSATPDFSHYNIYRSSSTQGSYELLAKSKTESFVDKINKDGKEYYYKISVVDKDNLESQYDRLSLQGITLSKPTPPALLNVKNIKNKIELLWKKTDQRAVKYIVSKRAKKGWFDESFKEYNNITYEKFTDPNISSGTTYIYTVSSIDKYGIRSEPSKEFKIELKEDVVKTKPTKRVNKTSTKVKEVITPIEQF